MPLTMIASRLKNKRRKSSLGMAGAGGVGRRRRPDVSRSRSRPTIPFRRRRWEYFGAKFDWIHDGKIGAIRYASGISARSFHADTLLKDTAKPWRGAVR